LVLIHLNTLYAELPYNKKSGKRVFTIVIVVTGIPNIGSDTSVIGA